MNTAVLVIVLLSLALISLVLGIIVYCFKTQIGNMCRKVFQKNKKVHTITAPARASSGENEEVVLAMTQRRANNVSRTESINAPKTVASASLTLPPPSQHLQFLRTQNPHTSQFLTRHHSLYSQPLRRPPAYGSEVPSPLVSLSSLQSLLMSSQVAIFDSSTERLSLNSQNNQSQIPLAPSNLNGSALSIVPTVSSSIGHLPQPSYFDEPPPSYQESLLIRQLRASERLASRRENSAEQNLRFVNARRSCRV